MSLTKFQNNIANRQKWTIQINYNVIVNTDQFKCPLKTGATTDPNLILLLSHVNLYFYNHAWNIQNILRFKGKHAYETVVTFANNDWPL